MDGSQFVCLGTNDFFGLINRHLSGVVQFAAIGIKGHMAEAKNLVSCQFVTQKIWGGLAVVVDDTIRRTISQLVVERSQSSRERNGFQMDAIFKGIRFNFCYFFRDGDGLEF